MAKQRGRQGPADGEPQSENAGDADDTTPTPSQRGQRSVGANPQHVVARRVAFVRACLIAGYTTTDIRRKVAKAYRNEADARRRHREAVDMTDPAELEKLPPLVWGDPTDTEPPHDRTIDRYIAKAKRDLEDDGKAAARLGDRLFGIQLARINQSYRVALAKKAPSAMVRVVEATNDLFAFDGAVRPSLTALTAGGDQPRTGDKAPPPEASLTAASALAEMQALLDVARARQLAQTGSQTAVPPTTEDTAP